MCFIGILETMAMELLRETFFLCGFEARVAPVPTRSCFFLSGLASGVGKRTLDTCVCRRVHVRTLSQEVFGPLLLSCVLLSELMLHGIFVSSVNLNL